MWKFKEFRKYGVPFLLHTIVMHSQTTVSSSLSMSLPQGGRSSGTFAGSSKSNARNSQGNKRDSRTNAGFRFNYADFKLKCGEFNSQREEFEPPLNSPSTFSPIYAIMNNNLLKFQKNEGEFE